MKLKLSRECVPGTNSRSFQRQPDFIFAFSKRPDGNMSFTYGETEGSLQRRKVFLGSLGLDYKRLICPRQVHADNIRLVGEPDIGSGAESDESAIVCADGLVTDQRNVPIAVLTADCLSIFLFDPRRKAIAIIHSGWRSCLMGIAEKAVRLMREKFNTRPDSLQAYLGPAIRQCCYEVGEEFSGYFPGFIQQRNGRNYLDLPAANKASLIGSGLRQENIIDSSVCTCCQRDNFYSLRADGGHCGRIISVGMLY